MDVRKLAFYKTLTRAADRHSPREIFREFCAMAACQVSLGLREAEYLEWVTRMGGAPGVPGSATPELLASVEAFRLFLEETERRPHEDLLGPAWMELNGGGSSAQWSGEFYTPQSISRFMAMMLFSEAEIPEDRPLRLSEPASGSGGMVLSVVEVLAERGVAPNRLWVEARDVNRTACDMAYVNLALRGIPGVVIHGNTLSMEEWGRWRTPWRTAFERSPVEEAVLEAGRLVESVIEGRELIGEERTEGEDPERPDRKGPQGEEPAEREVRDGEDAGGRGAGSLPRQAAGGPGDDRLTLF